MNKKNLTICICFVVLMIIFNGCEKQEKSSVNTENKSLTTQVEVKEGIQNKLSNEILEEKNWDSIRNFTQFIGQPISLLGDQCGIFNYEWYGDDKQQVSVESNVFYYSGILFGSDEDVTCTAISALGFDALPPNFDENTLTEAVIKEYWGNGYTYHKQKGNVNGYYKYTFEGLEVIFYENPDGDILQSDNCIFIKAIDQDFNVEMIVNDIDQESNFLDAGVRTGDKWKSVNQYSKFLNKPMEKVIVDENRFEFHEESFTYTDLSTSIRYTYYINDTGTPICSVISVPISLLLSIDNKSNITMNDLRSYWGIEFSWFLYEGYSCCYSFNDAMIYIPSDENGIIDLKDLAYLKPSPTL